ncbi:hypothetical protein BC939DRAFT_441918 [Gamsiella multidivaricata]|uniref:uncharacterized protein n=1 Tax=Gamsiella multidivaricata TaxID=101098 RepID=UPI00221F5F98|nr:uncharacterized protein BC939DRAFT_441918 [Gamsiella multidivaricata]KAI7829442.1 hypothetical protein BC939DRAFT_441918 [Gamsiella multidivaricata]
MILNKCRDGLDSLFIFQRATAVPLDFDSKRQGVVFMQLKCGKDIRVAGGVIEKLQFF